MDKRNEKWSNLLNIPKLAVAHLPERHISSKDQKPHGKEQNPHKKRRRTDRHHTLSLLSFSP